MAETETPAPSSGETGHELSDLRPKGIALFGLGLTVTLIVVLYAMYALLGWFRSSDIRRQVPLNPFSETLEPAPGPRLLVQPGRELEAMRREAEARLNSYGWIDREQGIVHIPIERAMEILAQKGLPARRKNESAAAGDTRVRNPTKPAQEKSQR